jgi:hypothetical protein
LSATPTTPTNDEDKLVWDPSSGRFFERDLDEICAEEFCVLDDDTGKPILLTREEKERIFLDTIQQYYYDGKTSLSDERFNRLKEDLSWEGSVLVTLNRNETLFMNAIQAWNKGAPILGDKEFDDLKLSLRQADSKIAVSSEPKCWVDTGVCKATWTPDGVRQTSLYLPAAVVSTLLFIGIADEIPGVAALNVLIVRIHTVTLLSLSLSLSLSIDLLLPACLHSPTPHDESNHHSHPPLNQSINQSHYRCWPSGRVPSVPPPRPSRKGCCSTTRTWRRAPALSAAWKTECSSEASWAWLETPRRAPSSAPTARAASP